MKAKFYVSLMIFLITALFFPVMYGEALNANISNTALENTVKIFPLILLVIIVIFPIYYGLEGE